MAIEINEQVFRLGSELAPSDRVVWRLDDAAMVLDDLAESFDMVVGSPPINLPRTTLEISPGFGLTASKSYTMLVQAARRLSGDGVILAVLPESFFAPSNSRVREALAAASAYPAAALSLPARGFSSSSPLSLVVLTRVREERIFAAELDPATDLDALVRNLREETPGPAAGAWPFAPE